MILSALARHPRYDCQNWDKQENSTDPWTLDNLIASDIEVSQDGASVEATFECYFDWGKKFGINFDKIEEEANDYAWLNLYANYFPESGRLTMYFTVDDNHKHEQFEYVPSEEERIIVVTSMEMSCKKECGCTMAELIMSFTNEENEKDSERYFCEVVFGDVKNENSEFSVLVSVDSHNHDEGLSEAFCLTVEERQAAYLLAGQVLSKVGISDHVIRRASFFVRPSIS